MTLFNQDWAFFTNRVYCFWVWYFWIHRVTKKVMTMSGLMVFMMSWTLSGLLLKPTNFLSFQLPSISCRLTTCSMENLVNATDVGCEINGTFLFSSFRSSTYSYASIWSISPFSFSDFFSSILWDWMLFFLSWSIYDFRSIIISSIYSSSSSSSKDSKLIFFFAISSLNSCAGFLFGTNYSSRLRRLFDYFVWELKEGGWNENCTCYWLILELLVTGFIAIIGGGGTDFSCFEKRLENALPTLSKNPPLDFF